MQFAKEKDSSGLCNPWLSNIGVLSSDKIYLGGIEIEDYYMLGIGGYSLDLC